jgi:hypothetical protein
MFLERRQSARSTSLPRPAYAGDVVDTSTPIRSPAPPPPHHGTATLGRPRRRWLHWLVLGVVIAFIAIVAAGLVLASTYQPFKAGFKQYGPPKGVEATALQIDWLDAPPNVWTYRVPSHKGLTFTYRFSIWNHGPVPITVTRLGIPVSKQAGQGLTVVPVAVDANVYGGGGWEPVHPLTLHSRQMSGVEMRVTITSCLEHGATIRWNTVPVTFKVYGIERHVFAPMNVQIDLVGTQTECGSHLPASKRAPSRSADNVPKT